MKIWSKNIWVFKNEHASEITASFRRLLFIRQMYYKIVRYFHHVEKQEYPEKSNKNLKEEFVKARISRDENPQKQETRISRSKNVKKRGSPENRNKNFEKLECSKTRISREQK